MTAPWKILGVERSADRNAIRKAYAAKLKAIDVEADPAAFIQLRAALEQALAHVAERQWREQAREAHHAPADSGAPAYGEAEVLADKGEWLDAARVPPEAEAAEDEAAWDDYGDEDFYEDPQAWIPPLPDEWTQRCRRLDQLLFGLDGEMPDSQELEGATREILDHLHETSIDKVAQVELWLAESALAAIPRADTIIHLLIAHFGWEKGEGEFDQPYAFGELVRRWRGWVFVDQLRRESHPLHDAFIELSRPEERLGFNRFTIGNRVEQLLATIRQKCPSAEAELAAHRVALWDERLNRSVGSRLKWLILVFWALFIIARIGSCSQEADRQSNANRGPGGVSVSETRPAYDNPRADLEWVLTAFEGGRLRLPEIERQGPALNQRLVAVWRQARDRRDPGPIFHQNVGVALNAAYRDSLRSADGALLSAYWQNYRDRLAHLRQRPADCASYIVGGPGNFDFPIALENSSSALRIRFLLATPERPRAASTATTFAIPEPIFQDTRRRANLTVDQLRPALRDGGTPAHRCAARIAIIEAALEGGAPGRRLLRDMSAGL